MRTNKRRNLTSSQWAAVAVEADEIIAAIKAKVEGERRKKQAATLAATHESGNFGVSVNKLTETNQDERKAAHKTAELFNTNRTTDSCLSTKTEREKATAGCFLS